MRIAKAVPITTNANKDIAMTTRHLVDPELLPMLDAWPTVDLNATTLPRQRARTLEQFGREGAGGDAVTLDELRVPGPDGTSLRLLVYRPRQQAEGAAAIYHCHGGGMVSGTPEMMDARNRKLVAELGCVLVSVDYRLAPEHPHPAPIEDCYAGLHWLHHCAADLGVDPARIAVMGESAGGGLAASLALLARDRGEVSLCHQFLICPMLDDRTCAEAEPNPCTGEFIWTRATNYFGWSSLLGGEPGTPGVSPYASPARAEDLAGLPPAFLYSGGLDLFVDECLAYGRRLGRAGVAVELHVYPGAFHGFENMHTSRVARQAQGDTLAALRKALPSAS